MLLRLCMRVYLCVRLSRLAKHAYAKGSISAWKARKNSVCSSSPLIEFPLHEICIEGIVYLALFVYLKFKDILGLLFTNKARIEELPSGMS